MLLLVRKPLYMIAIVNGRYLNFYSDSQLYYIIDIWSIIIIYIVSRFTT